MPQPLSLTPHSFSALPLTVSVENPVSLGWVSVKSYGAVGDGETDDRTAIENAISAATSEIESTGRGITVYFPPGVYLLESQSTRAPTNPATGSAYTTKIGVPLPVGLSATLTIMGAGSGATTIKLSDNARNVFWIDQSANYDTFKNIVIEDLTVDNNNTEGRCHILVGNMPAAFTPQRRLNYENITVRRVEITNVGLDETQATTAKSGVLLLGTHAAALEATQTSSTDVTVEDLVQAGGDNCVGVTSWGAGSLVGGTNHYYNRIAIRRCRHTIPSVPSATYSQTSFYVCGSGFGDWFEIVDCESTNIADDGIEVGAMQAGLIDGVTITNPFLTGILFRNTHALQDVDSQRIVVRNVQVNVDSDLAAVSGMIGRPVDWIGDNSLTFGEFHFESLGWSGDSLTYANQGRGEICFYLTAPVARVVFDKLAISLNGYTVSTGSGTVNASLFRVNTTSGTVVIRDLQVIADVAASTGGGLVFNFHGLVHDGSGNRVFVDGYDGDFTGTAYTNGTGGSVYFYYVARSGGSTIRNELRRFYPRGTSSLTGVGLRAITLGAGGTISSFTVSNSDISAMSSIVAGRDIEVLGNGSKLIVRDVVGASGRRLGPNGRIATATNYTVLSYDGIVGVTSTASARTITLPAVNAVPVGHVYTIVDESNAAGTNNITVSRAGSDTFTDTATSKAISTNGGVLRVYSNGSNWVVA